MFEWAIPLGIIGKKAPQKRVPECIFALEDKQIELFMGRLWAGDGHISTEKSFQPFYATASPEMARDVHELLLRIGVVSRIHTKSFKYTYKGITKFVPGYTVHIIGGVSMRIFWKK